MILFIIHQTPEACINVDEDRVCLFFNNVLAFAVLITPRNCRKGNKIHNTLMSRLRMMSWALTPPYSLKVTIFETDFGSPSGQTYEGVSGAYMDAERDDGSKSVDSARC